MANIAIMGFGTVGGGTYDIIANNPVTLREKCGQYLSVRRVLDLLDFPDSPIENILTKNFDDILNDSEIDVVVETMGGTKPAYEFTKALLESGKSVVTSNKEMVASYGQELKELAAKNGVKYLFEASVCAAIPIIHSLQNRLASSNITEIMGILNGTTNYILTKMLKSGESFDSVLKEAQQKGYAERDPAADVEGHDTCRKIAILAWLGFGELGKEVHWSKIPTEGITKVTIDDLKKADAEGYVVKLIGHAKIVEDKVECSVKPTRVPKDSPLANIDDVYNAILVKGDAAGDVMFYGRGAGDLATGSSIVADIMEVARG